ncbi:6-carboxytetrahydropterin synthase QueD [Nitrosomonas sp. HPC101]|uniref:6-carboxytetrahydropterin synthase QueD n=1 Tax=Nitrosomonas sp. HPC101 TaxID=1658667 RepID=UPI0013684A40|nr:6-carboxytetrahydropterin synthase QueD [Nitrosomonas sp. HPC101]MXS85714.1 6-carboxytetrahydropterin synthase QueD [Nitrosomonas sp. HPC101]
MLITRKFEFDAGHRISTHQSQCRNLHGHRYVLEVTISGGIITDTGAPEQGMVMDFSDVKRIIREALVDQWDHAFLVYAGDIRVLEFLQSMDDHKTVVLEVQPTAENLALIAFDILHHMFRDRYAGRLALEHVRLFETPNCWADVNKADFASGLADAIPDS